MPSALIDLARPESHRASLLNRVWTAVTRWRRTPEANPQDGPLVEVRDLMWSKLQAGDTTLGGQRSEALARAAPLHDAGAFKARGDFTSRAYFDMFLDGFGAPRGMVRDEPIRARARGQGGPPREAERSVPGDLARVWGLDAQGRRTREAPNIALPPREQRTGKAQGTPPPAPAQPAPARVYLDVPYAEKDRVKAAGARWDKGRKAWYVPEGRDAAAFRSWLPGRAQAREADPVAEFAEALRRAGLDVPRPEMDGKLHRVRVDGDKGREKSGAYVGHLNGYPAGRPGGFIQNFKTGEKVNWRQERAGKPMDRAEMAKLAAEREARKAAEQERLAEQHRAASRTAQAVWDRAAQAPNDHPYVARKGVDGRDARVGVEGQSITVSDGKGGTRDMSVAGWLIVPVFTKDRGPSSLQFISPEPDGGKVFLPGGQMRGGHCVIGHMGQGSTVLICEGWATGKTLHALTGLPVVVSFNAGNLREVAEMVAARHPERTILVAGDNDHKKERETDPRTGKPRENVGRVRAEEAARAVGGVAVPPPFKAHEKGSDWNDFASLRGPATARSVLRGMVAEAERAAARAAERGTENVVPFGHGRSQPARSQVRERDRGAPVEMER